MSRDPAANLQIFSPPGSGRSSPSPRISRNTTEDASYKKDKNFRRYAAGVERALALWDTAQQEWADYISFLARLLKALQAHPLDIPVISHSNTVALRLSQCLNPALPSGVHQKALEVYGYIFQAIGKDALSRDLNLYFPGLAPVPSFASLSIRPLFLSLFESYILKVDGAALRPALKAVILCVLPGLEDETSEDFERMVSALDKLRHAVRNQSDEIGDAKSEGASSQFWQSFFLATITNTSRRQGALAFLVRRLPKFSTANRRDPLPAEPSETLIAEAEAAISPEPGLLIRCFEAGLSDPQLLIQRGFLDLLVSHLPLDSPVLQQRISRDDLERLVTAAAGVVSRREMSLNRRLWAWFLGPEPSAGTAGGEPLDSPTLDKPASVDPSTYHTAYFSKHGLQALTRSIMRMIHRPSYSPVDRAKPFRICLSLMDRWEVGGLIVPDVFLPALQSIQSYSESATKEQVDEVLRSASIFFDGVESGLIWGKLIHLVTSALDAKDISREERLRRIKLAKFVLSRFNLKEDEMLLHHMPLMVLSTLGTLNLSLDSALDTTKPQREVVDLALEIVDSVVQIIPDRAVRADLTEDKPLISAIRPSRENAFQKIKLFYEEHQGNLDFSEPPFTKAELGQFILQESSCTVLASIRPSSALAGSEMPSKILSNLVFKVQNFEALDKTELVPMFQKLFLQSSDPNSILPFPYLVAITQILSALQSARPLHPYLGSSQLAEIMHPLIASLWYHLSPFMPKYHVETVRCILQLHTISASYRMVEAALSSIIVYEKSTVGAGVLAKRSETGRRFSILWIHTMYELSIQTEKRGSLSRRVSTMGVPPPLAPIESFQAILTRPLLLLLDSLVEEGTELSSFMKTWLQDLASLNSVFDILSHHLQSLNCLKDRGTLALNNVSSKQRPPTEVDDTKECLYYLQHILRIVSRPSNFTWATIAEELAPQDNEYSAPEMRLQEWLVRICLKVLAFQPSTKHDWAHFEDLQRTAITIISLIYQGPTVSSLRELEIEVPLMETLRNSSSSLQSLLLEALIPALRLRTLRPAEQDLGEPKSTQQSSQRSRLSFVADRSSLEPESAPVPPPPQLINCLKHGFSSPSSRLVLDDWVHFLTEVLPLFADTIFQNLLPLVECLCKQIKITFEQLKDIFNTSHSVTDISPETTIISLINGLEQVLAKAHDRLMVQETRSTTNKSPEQPQGFFGNMVSGVFTSESNQTRIPTANSRLTVLLCFQDTVGVCFAIWSWGGYDTKDGRQDLVSASSFAYTSLRIRNRARRILEHLFAAEALECLETLMVTWAHSMKDDSQSTAVMGLLNVLNGSKPKHTIPAIFNAVYSRTNPSALDPNRMSSLTSDLTDTDLVAFLVDYTRSLEDDAMDEIWSDCTLFLRDVLANPFPHRQILPPLLEFTAVIGQKVDNTNFGEQRKMRKELADIFTRILTAMFTTRSMGFLQEPSQAAGAEKSATHTNGGPGSKRGVDVVSTLVSIVPHLPVILVENDRVTNVVTQLATNVVGPTFKAKAFPENVSKPILDLLYQLARVAQANKFWKKETYEAFNDARFFNTPLLLLKSSWLPILAQWAHSDKDRVPELLSRLSAPTTAGIMFGVGAASARQEADRKTQLTLRRIALLLLAAPEDTFTPNLPQIMEKVVELFTATPASSPSSITRGEVFVLLRAITLKTSSVHLAPLWPIINGELTSALSSLLPDAENKESYNNIGIIQACKLLDQLIVLDPDDFQLIEWLFITDTIDAVYKPHSAYPTSLTDEISEILSVTDTPTSRVKPMAHHQQLSTSDTSEPKRRLFLDPLIEALEDEEDAEVTDMARRELVDRVVRPFLGQLAMWAFEAKYEGGAPDWEGCEGSVVADAKGVD